MLDAFLRKFEPLDPDDDDGPELHLRDLRGDDLRVWFALLDEHGADFGDSSIWDPATETDVLVREHPDPAGAVVERDATTTPSVTGIRVDGVELPLLSFFAFADQVQLFWYPSSHRWTRDEIRAFAELLRRFRERVPHARLLEGGP